MHLDTNSWTKILFGDLGLLSLIISQSKMQLRKRKEFPYWLLKGQLNANFNGAVATPHESVCSV